MLFPAEFTSKINTEFKFLNKEQNLMKITIRQFCWKYMMQVIKKYQIKLKKKKQEKNMDFSST